VISYLNPLGPPCFPDPSGANADGLLCVGGKLDLDWLLEAYTKGIFPWYGEGDPILWWSPDPRCILFPEKVKVSHSMRNVINRPLFHWTMDTCFERVIQACASAKRQEQSGTWITNEMKAAYLDLHKAGYAHSVEVWSGGQLAGGLYGVSIGAAFFGESMFSMVPNASKYGLIKLCGWLADRDFKLIDCQMTTPHLLSMGAETCAFSDFQARLAKAVAKATKKGCWRV